MLQLEELRDCFLVLELIIIKHVVYLSLNALTWFDPIVRHFCLQMSYNRTLI